MVISVLGGGVFWRVLFMMCLFGDFTHSVSLLMICRFAVGIWLCFMFEGWYGEFLCLL